MPVMQKNTRYVGEIEMHKFYYRSIIVLYIYIYIINNVVINQLGTYTKLGIYYN